MRRTTIFIPEDLRFELLRVARRGRASLSDALRLAAEELYRGKTPEQLEALAERLRVRRFSIDRRFSWNRKRPEAG